MQEQEAAQGEGSEHDIDDVDVNNAAVSNLDIRSFASKKHGCIWHEYST